MGQIQPLTTHDSKDLLSAISNLRIRNTFVFVMLCNYPIMYADSIIDENGGMSKRIKIDELVRLAILDKSRHSVLFFFVPVDPPPKFHYDGPSARRVS